MPASQHRIKTNLAILARHAMLFLPHNNESDLNPINLASTSIAKNFHACLAGT